MTIKDIENKYRGIKIEELNTFEPSHSCIICSNKQCYKHNTPTHGCDECKITSEVDWLSFYDFYRE